MSLNQIHEYQIKTRIILTIRRKNKTWIYLGIDESEYNESWLFIYIMNNYNTLFVAKAIFMVVAWVLGYLACTPSCLKAMPYDLRQLYSGDLGLKLFGLYLKSSKGGSLCLKVLPPLYYNFLEVSRV